MSQPEQSDSAARKQPDPPVCELTLSEVGLAIDAVAMLVRPQEHSDYRPLLHKLQDAYKEARRAAA